MADRLREQRPPVAVIGEDETVYVTESGTPLDESNLRHRVLAPAACRAQLPWVGFHTFRHTCATLLLQSGKTPIQVAGWLGHSDPFFTQKTYVHLVEGAFGDPDFLDATLRSVRFRIGPPENRAGGRAGDAAVRLSWRRIPSQTGDHGPGSRSPARMEAGHPAGSCRRRWPA
jgi:hypothetical protein